jgi:hypothetical protein
MHLEAEYRRNQCGPFSRDPRPKDQLSMKMQAIGRFAVALAASAVAACGSSSGPTTADVLDPTQPHYGNSYDQWSVLWWQWLYQLPETAAAGPDGGVDTASCIIPLADPTGANCQYRQSGSVFFLAGTAGGAAVRDKCTVPLGDAIFFPLVNFSNDNAGVPTGMLQTPAQLSALTKSELDVVPLSGLSAEFDGLPITNLARFKSNIDQYTYTLPPEPNVYTCEGATGVTGLVNPSYEAGYWVMLPPPPAGAHKLHFAASSPSSQPPLTVDVTYNFTVQ